MKSVSRLQLQQHPLATSSFLNLKQRCVMLMHCDTLRNVAGTESFLPNGVSMISQIHCKGLFCPDVDIFKLHGSATTSDYPLSTVYLQGGVQGMQLFIYPQSRSLPPF